MSKESSMVDCASSQSEPEDKQAGVFFESPQIFDRLLNWLTGLFHLTEKEQQQAGIDLSNQGR